MPLEPFQSPGKRKSLHVSGAAHVLHEKRRGEQTRQMGTAVLGWLAFITAVRKLSLGGKVKQMDNRLTCTYLR